MPNIGRHSLIPVHLVRTIDGSPLARSRDSQVPRLHDPDPQVKVRRLRGTWSNVLAQTVIAIRQHFEQWQDVAFLLRGRGLQEPVYVIWINPPQIQWNSGATAATATAEFEEALVNDNTE